MNLKRYHFVYLTTNIKTGRKYIGKHSTFDLDDDYLGSSVELNNDIKKIGRKFFKRKILEFFNTEDEAFEGEKRYIKEHGAVLDENYYNYSAGGKNPVIHNQIVECVTTGKAFESIKDAMNCYNIKDHDGIRDACEGLRKYCGEDPITKEKLVWKYKFKKVEKIRPHTGTPIEQYDENGKKIAEYQTINEAQRITKIRRSSISKCINGHNDTAGGFIFKRKYDELPERYARRKKNTRSVVCLNTGEFFESTTEAKDKYKLSKHTRITDVCNNKQKTAGTHPITKEALRWMYEDEYIKQEIS